VSLSARAIRTTSGLAWPEPNGQDTCTRPRTCAVNRGYKQPCSNPPGGKASAECGPGQRRRPLRTRTAATPVFIARDGASSRSPPDRRSRSGGAALGVGRRIPSRSGPPTRIPTAACHQLSGLVAPRDCGSVVMTPTRSGATFRRGQSGSDPFGMRSRRARAVASRPGRSSTGGSGVGHPRHPLARPFVPAGLAYQRLTLD